MYFVETTLKLLSGMLDVAYDVIPLLEVEFGKEYGAFRGVMVIVIGFDVGLHTRLASFFWQKVFYGEKDLFSEPSDNLIEEAIVYETTKHNELGEAIELDEIGWI